MLQEPPEFGPELDPDDVLGLVGLDGSEADPALPCQVVATGVPQVLACVRDAAALRRVLPAYDRIGRLLAEHGAITLYLAAVDPEAGTARARSFMRSAEMGEDPATGSAVGPLCAHVLARTGIAAARGDAGRRDGAPQPTGRRGGRRPRPRGRRRRGPG